MAGDNDSEKDMSKFVQFMPKVELHAHLNGCIREATLFELARERGVTLSQDLFLETTANTSAMIDASTCDKESQQHKQQQINSNNDDDDDDDDDKNEYDHSMYNVRPRSLQDCFDMFAQIPKCVNDLPALKRITMEAMEDFASHHVAYLELRSTPKVLLVSSSSDNSTENNTSSIADKRVYCETILQCMKEFEQREEERYQQDIKMSTTATTTTVNCRLPMVCRFIVAIDRSGSIQEAMEHVELAISLKSIHKEHLVGVDLGGNPTKNHFNDFLPAFEKARQAGLKITLHCAEVPCNDNDDTTQAAFEEAQAILNFRPNRLGHALLLPSSLQEKLLEMRIPVESCPTSNVMTLELAKHYSGSLLEGLKQHPQLKKWLDTKHPISIGTDDPGVFHTTATKEFLLLQRAFGVDKSNLQRIVMESMEQAFCDDNTKRATLERIRKRIDRQFF